MIQQIKVQREMRILTSLLHEVKVRNKDRGIAYLLLVGYLRLDKVYFMRFFKRVFIHRFFAKNAIDG